MENAQVESAPATETTKENEKPAEIQVTQEKRKFKGKVNGRDAEVDEDTLVKNWQKYESADERFREASEVKKKYGKYEELEKALQEGDLSVLSKYTSDEKLKGFAEKYLLDYLEYEGLSDEQKEAMALKKENEAYKKKEDELKKAEEQKQREFYNSEAIKVLDQEIFNTLKELGEKPTPAKISRMAEHMLASLNTNGQLLGVKDAYKRATFDLNKDLGTYLESLPPEKIMNLLPKSVIDGVRKKSVEEVYSQPYSIKNKSENQDGSRDTKVRSTVDDYFKTLDKKYQKGR